MNENSSKKPDKLVRVWAYLCGLPELIWRDMQDKVFKNRPSKICARQPLKSLKGHGVFKPTISLQIFWRLSSTNFTWSILEKFVSCKAWVKAISCLWTVLDWLVNPQKLVLFHGYANQWTLHTLKYKHSILFCVKIYSSVRWKNILGALLVKNSMLRFVRELFLH